MRIIISILFLFCFSAVYATNFYVSASGNDGNPGTIGSPWQTLTKVNSHTFAAGDSLFFNRGDAFPGFLRPSHSNLYIGAYGSGAKPIVSGFTTLGSWVSLGGGVYEAACPSCSATENLVVLNGIEQPLARFPNIGYDTFQVNVGTTRIVDTNLTGTPDHTGFKIAIRSSHFDINRATITSQSIDTLTFSPAVDYTTAGGFGYFFQGDASLLDQIGEWCLNATKDSVKMFFGGGGPGTNVVQASVVDTVVWFGGNALTLENLDIQGGNMYNVMMTNSSLGGNTIKNCNITYSGGVGIYGNNEIVFTVINDSINYSLSNGITIVGTSPSVYIGHNSIRNSGILQGMGGSGNGGTYEGINSPNKGLYEYNVIDSSGYTGMYFSGDSSVAQFNTISNFCFIKNDGGGIYIWDAAKGTFTNLRKIINNTITGGKNAFGGIAYDSASSASGVYVDGKADSVVISGNKISYCSSNGIFIHGSQITVRNDTVYGHTYSQVQVAEVSGAPITGLVFKNNILVDQATGQQMMHFSSVANDLTSFGTIDSNYYFSQLYGTTPFYTKQPSDAGTFRTLSSWQINMSADAHSQFPLGDYSANITGLVQGVYIFRLVVYDDSGDSAYDDVQVTVNANTPPVVNAGPDQNIVLPTTSVTLTGSYTDDNGTAVSTTWTRITGPNNPTIVSPNATQTNVTGLVQGDYTFRLSVTDIGGLVGTDDVIIHVLPSGAPPAGTINVRIYSGTAPFQNTAWNNWNISNADITNIVSPTFLKDDGTSSGISATLSASQGISDNTTSYGDNMAPDTALRFTSFSSAVSRTITFNGLVAGNVYSFNFYSSRNTTNNNTTTFSIVNQPNQAVLSDTNHVRVATFTSVAPVSGSIVVTLTKSTSFTYLNAFSITVGAAGNQPPTANAGPDKTIVVPTSTVTFNGSGTDVDGTIAAYSWTQISGPNTAGISSPTSATTAVTGLIQGNYIFRLTVTDNLGATGTDDVGVSVLPSGPTPPVANAGLDFSIADSIPVFTLDGSNSTGNGLTYQWTNIQKPNANIWCAMILSPTAPVSLVNWTGTFGTYSFQLKVTDNIGNISLDTVVVTVFYSTPTPPQNIDAARWHYATANDLINIPFANLNDVIITGANTDGYAPNHTNASIFMDFTNGGGFSVHNNTKIMVAGGKYLDVSIYINKDSIFCDSLHKGILTNYNGQVQTQSIELGAMTNIRWTGKYDPILKTGDINFQGHAAGNYAYNSGTYGWFINNGFRSPDKFIVNMVRSDSTRNFEMDYIEYGNGGFSFVLGKLNGASMRGISIHDIYGHDTHGEGTYWGRTEANQSLIYNLKFYNSRIIRSGNEIFQLVDIGTDDSVYNNVFFMSAMNWMSTFDYDQDFGIQWGLGQGGRNFVSKNILYGSGEQVVSYIIHSHTTPAPTNITDTWANNIFFSSRGPVNMFLGDQTAGNFSSAWNSNYFGHNYFRLGRIYNTSTARGVNTTNTFRLQQNDTPVKTYAFTTNHYDTTKSTFIDNNTGVTLTGNTLDNPPFAGFVNTGWNDTVSVTRISMYADTVFWFDHTENPNMGTASNQYQAIAYDSGEYVFFQGKCFQSRKNANVAPCMWVTDANWLQITWNGKNMPPDDVRVFQNGFYGSQGIGLLDQGSSCIGCQYLPASRGFKHIFR